ncbi:MAG: UDP binding domain-containing protein, partial [Pyrinomonadaceae bacterium]
SQGVQIAEHLSRRGFRVVAFDPLSSEMSVPEHGWSFLVLDSLQDCLQQSQTVIVTTPDPLFASLTEEDFAGQWATVNVFDLWRILRDQLSRSERIIYRGAGLGVDSSAASQRLKDIWTSPEDSAVVAGRH